MFDSNDHPAKAQPFWDGVKRGEICVVLSDALVEELENAPDYVWDFYCSIQESQVERIVSSPMSDTLAERYVKARILSQNHFNDCKHVALATTAYVDALVSWNTKHIVNTNRIRRFNDVSIGFGCNAIEILTPYSLTQRGE
jgi:predicted nucleic acid-binding protein